MHCPNDRYVNDEQICLAVTSMLARIGIKAKLEAPPKAVFFGRAGLAGGYDTSFGLLGWTPSGFDSLNIFQNLTGCRDDRAKRLAVQLRRLLQSEGRRTREADLHRDRSGKAARPRHACMEAADRRRQPHSDAPAGAVGGVSKKGEARAARRRRDALPLGGEVGVEGCASFTAFLPRSGGCHAKGDG